MTNLIAKLLNPDNQCYGFVSPKHHLAVSINCPHFDTYRLAMRISAAYHLDFIDRIFGINIYSFTKDKPYHVAEGYAGLANGHLHTDLIMAHHPNQPQPWDIKQLFRGAKMADNCYRYYASLTD